MNDLQFYQILHFGQLKHKYGITKGILAKNLRKYRTRLKLTQEQASEKADITMKYWQRLEMESQIDLPSLPVLFKIAKSLKIQPYQLLK
jgi:transcriptional regulator with XRE-family HTH domain